VPDDHLTRANRSRTATILHQPNQSWPPSAQRPMRGTTTAQLPSHGLRDSWDTYLISTRGTKRNPPPLSPAATWRPTANLFSGFTMRAGHPAAWSEGAWAQCADVQGSYGDWRLAGPCRLRSCSSAFRTRSSSRHPACRVWRCSCPACHRDGAMMCMRNSSTHCAVSSSPPAYTSRISSLSSEHDPEGSGPINMPWYRLYSPAPTVPDGLNTRPL
jgi:hypothetical protein